MVRRKLAKKDIVKNPYFEFRGDGSSRTEALSDGIFALAITLLIISTEVPNNFKEIYSFVNELVPFALCMASLIWLWFEHYQFFMRYALENRAIIALNALLMFIILFYVYPLKFLAKLLTLFFPRWLAELFGYDQDLSLIFPEMIQLSELPELMVIYGAGLAAIFLTFFLMYWLAYNKRDEMKLSALEVFETKYSMIMTGANASLPILSIIIALSGVSNVFFWSGMLYFLYWPMGIILSKKKDRDRKAFFGV